MTDSAVLDTILGLIFLFYALALLCGGLVEMIANWVQKRAKYLLRGIGDLLEDVEDKATAVPKDNAWGRMQDNVRDALRDGSYEQRRYELMLTAPIPTAPQESAKIPAGARVTPDQPPHRKEITVGDVMGHALVQPFRHATSLGKPTRNPAYLPSSVFARTLVDLLTPGDSMEPTLADLESGVRALEHSPKLQQSLASILKSAKGDVEGFISGAPSVVRPPDGPGHGLLQALGQTVGDHHCHRGGVRLQPGQHRHCTSSLHQRRRTCRGRSAS